MTGIIKLTEADYGYTIYMVTDHIRCYFKVSDEAPTSIAYGDNPNEAFFRVKETPEWITNAMLEVTGHGVGGTK